MPVLQIAMALAQFAPSLMRYLGADGNSVATAEKAVAIAQQVTGTSSPEAALEALKANAQAAQQYRMAVLEADRDLERDYLADRQDARKRDVAFIQAGRQNVRADLMVLGAVTGLIACLVCLVLFRQGLPGEAVGIISTVSGIFGACLRDAFQFEFGSSRGSREKDSVIGSLSVLRGPAK